MIADRRPKALVLGAGPHEAAIREKIGDLTDVVASENDLALGPQLLRAHNPRLVIIDFDANPQLALEVTRAAGSITGGACMPIVVSAQRDPENILVAMRAGARDFAFLDEGCADVRRAVLGLRSIDEAVREEQAGTIITVFSAKGGSGATTIASNLAGALAKLEGPNGPLRVALLDFNLEMGDVLAFLDMKAPYSYRELLANLHRLDADLLFRSLAKHSSGVYVMSQTDYLDEGRTLSGDDAKDVVTFLARHFDFVIIDGVRDFSDVALAALDKANHIMLTMTQDIPALKNAHRCLRIFHRLGYTDERIHLVLNRYRNAGSLTTEAVGDALARPVNGTISNDFPSVSASVNEGRVLVDSHPSSRVAKDITTLVGLYHQLEAPKRRSLFARWSKP